MQLDSQAPLGTPIKRKVKITHDRYTPDSRRQGRRRRSRSLSSNSSIERRRRKGKGKEHTIKDNSGKSKRKRADGDRRADRRGRHSPRYSRSTTGRRRASPQQPAATEQLPTMTLAAFDAKPDVLDEKALTNRVQT